MSTTYETWLKDGVEYELAVVRWRLRACMQTLQNGKSVWLLLNQNCTLPSLWVTPDCTLAYLETDGPNAETVIFLPDEIQLQFPIWGVNVPSAGDLTAIEVEEDFGEDTFDTAFWEEALR